MIIQFDLNQYFYQYAGLTKNTSIKSPARSNRAMNRKKKITERDNDDDIHDSS